VQKKRLELKTDLELWSAHDELSTLYLGLGNEFQIRLREVIWSSNPSLGKEEITRVFLHLTRKLTDWLKVNIKRSSFDIIPPRTHDQKGTLFLSPGQWRNIIAKILYADPDQRIALSESLYYMPIQVVLCLGGRKKSIYNQRLYQVWDPNNELDILCEKDLQGNVAWWEETRNNIPRKDQAGALLKDESTLLKELLETQNPVPFESLYGRELNEIWCSRMKRVLPEEEKSGKEFSSVANHISAGYANKGTLDAEFEEIKRSALTWYNNARSLAKEQGLIEEVPPVAKDKSPMDRAKESQLVGLALSGGGIRSATFNLGILQYFAEKGMLSYVDYLSTVSGGGYIGSWLVSWIKSAGSVSKVSDRLNGKKSVDPMAEEARPIRWLRMFSNYLTPSASIMSADSWTLGITWLRNTLINQFILVLITCSCLSLVLCLYYGWEQFVLAATYTNSPPTHITRGFVLGWSTIALIPACVIAGLGMHMYNLNYPPQKWLNIGKSRYLSLALNGWAFIGALSISAWMFHPMVPNTVFSNSFQGLSIGDMLGTLWPVIIVGSLGLLATAYIGRYQDYWDEANLKPWGHVAVILSSIFSAIAGCLLLAAVWKLMHSALPSFDTDQLNNHRHFKIWFIVGIPLILEVFSLVVVLRMVIMGRLFSDGRREWWGKMGAIKHRFSLIWMLVTYAVLFLLVDFKKIDLNQDTNPNAWVKLLALLGGWSGIIGFAVKLAYNTVPQKEVKSGLSAREMFIRFAPYLFIVGFILLNCYFLTKIEKLVDYSFVIKVGQAESKIGVNLFEYYLFLFVALGVLTLILSWRVGVNEFSLHYFYRNRLVRAYLGAARRRADREKTVNDFTGFDEKDDQCLTKFQTCHSYYGPYPLINATLNSTVVSELDRQDRKAEAFLFSPLFCGFDFAATRSSSFSKSKVFDYGYRPTEKYAYDKGPTIGTALAISGAAVNPNRGHHSSQATAFLLTIFNVRMGWWMGNPRTDAWNSSDPSVGLAYIINDLIGKSNIDSYYVCLSDGGHFDNMGVYELVRRRCKWIILSDAEEDQQALCEGLANVIRRCRIDFGAEITIDVSPILEEKETHVTKGKILYQDGATGTLIYIKTVLTGDEPFDIREYQKRNQLFPNQSTGDQFFDEAQFESYRKLGYHSLQDKQSPTSITGNRNGKTSYKTWMHFQHISI